MKTKRLVLLLLLVAFLIRVVTVILTCEKNIGHGDASSYNSYAIAILQNEDWMTDPDFYGEFRPPVYPMLIALVYAVFGTNNLLTVYMFQAVIGVLTCLYIYKFSRMIFDDKIAVLSLVWSACYIYYLQNMGILMRETVIFFLLLIFFYYLYLYLKERKTMSRNLWFSLLFYCILIHTDPRYLFFLPFLVALFVVFQSSKQGVRNYFVFVGLTILLMVPWTIRNYVAYGNFVLINTRTVDLRGVAKRNPAMDQRLTVNILNLGVISQTSNEDYPTEEERELIKKGENPNNRTDREIEAIKKDVYPASTFWERKWFQFKEFWRPFRFRCEYRPFPDCRFVCWSLKHNLVSILCYGLLLPFMMYGIVDLLFKKNRIVWFLVFPLVIQTLLHSLQWAKTRYRNPIDAFVIILAFYGLTQVYKFLKKKYNLVKM